MADLPDSRLGYQYPSFANTGADYFGPTPCKENRKALRCAFYVLDYAGATPGNSSLIGHRFLVDGSKMDDGQTRKASQYLVG